VNARGPCVRNYRLPIWRGDTRERPAPGLQEVHCGIGEIGSGIVSKKKRQDLLALYARRPPNEPKVLALARGGRPLRLNGRRPLQNYVCVYFRRRRKALNACTASGNCHFEFQSESRVFTRTTDYWLNQNLGSRFCENEGGAGSFPVYDVGGV